MKRECPCPAGCHLAEWEFTLPYAKCKTCNKHFVDTKVKIKDGKCTHPILAIEDIDGL